MVGAAKSPGGQMPITPARRSVFFKLCLALSLALVLANLAPAATGQGATLPAPTAPTFTVNSLADVVPTGNLANGVCETSTGSGICTLRAAVMKANHYPGGGVTIILPANALPYQ